MPMCFKSKFQFLLYANVISWHKLTFMCLCKIARCSLNDFVAHHVSGRQTLDLQWMKLSFGSYYQNGPCADAQIADLANHFAFYPFSCARDLPDGDAMREGSCIRNMEHVVVMHTRQQSASWTLLAHFMGLLNYVHTQKQMIEEATCTSGLFVCFRTRHN